ncbi:ectoine synthase [Streptomyces sp. NPDC048291]|uniref:ectoine synthase n=1 Tax=Streptomyces sp. NPDC048291 TaxID=3365530 RepID=UPI003712FE71
MDTEGTVHPVAPGTGYSRDRHDAHWLVAHPEEDLRLVCVFSPWRPATWSAKTTVQLSGPKNGRSGAKLREHTVTSSPLR